MSLNDGVSRSIAFSSVVGPSRWWEVAESSDDVPPGWNDGAWTSHIQATSDENERATASHLESVRRSVASWDGDLESLTLVRSPASGIDGYRVAWTFQRGSVPRVEVSGPDEAQVAAYTANLQDRLAPRIDSMAAEDAAAAPPGQAGLVWPKLDALGTAIAVGISVVLVLVVAGVVWALSTR